MNERQFDRRRSKRIGVALPVILENATAVTRDASASGVFFWKRGTFMYGDFIRFAVERNTGSGKILQKCRGVVVRTEPDDNGVGVAARITESTTERVPGQPPGPELLEPAREEPRAIARPADNAPALASETVSPDAAREKPSTIEPPKDDSPAAAEKTDLVESAREQGSTIAWPTDEAYFSPDKTVSLDFVHEQPRTIAQSRDAALDSAVETVSRWSTLLRGMALDAREEFQGQEVLEWDIPPAANAITARSHRVTVCSVNVVGLRPGESPVRGNSRILGVSYWDLARLRARGGFKARRNAGAGGVGEDSQFLNRRNPRDGRGVRIELAIVANGSPAARTAGKTLLPRIVVRTTSVPDAHQQGLDTYCYEEASYSDPREAFEAFLGIAGESAILINLGLPAPEPRP